MVILLFVLLVAAYVLPCWFCGASLLGFLDIPSVLVMLLAFLATMAHSGPRCFFSGLAGKARDFDLRRSVSALSLFDGALCAAVGLVAAVCLAKLCVRSVTDADTQSLGPTLALALLTAFYACFDGIMSGCAKGRLEKRAARQSDSRTVAVPPGRPLMALLFLLCVLLLPPVTAFAGLSDLLPNISLTAPDFFKPNVLRYAATMVLLTLAALLVAGLAGDFFRGIGLCIGKAKTTDFQTVRAAEQAVALAVRTLALSGAYVALADVIITLATLTDKAEFVSAVSTAACAVVMAALSCLLLHPVRLRLSLVASGES